MRIFVLLNSELKKLAVCYYLPLFVCRVPIFVRRAVFVVLVVLAVRYFLLFGIQLGHIGW